MSGSQRGRTDLLLRLFDSQFFDEWLALRCGTVTFEVAPLLQMDALPRWCSRRDEPVVRPPVYASAHEYVPLGEEAKEAARRDRSDTHSALVRWSGGARRSGHACGVPGCGRDSELSAPRSLRAPRRNHRL